MSEAELYRIFFAIVKTAYFKWINDCPDPVMISKWMQGVLDMFEEVRYSLIEDTKAEQEGTD